MKIYMFQFVSDLQTLDLILLHFILFWFAGVYVSYDFAYIKDIICLLMF